MIDDQWLATQLKARGLATQAQLDAALRREGGDLSQNLVATGALPEADLLKFLGLLFQTRYVTTEKLSSAKIPQWVLELLPLKLCEEHFVLPVRCDKQKSELSIVAIDPSDQGVRELVVRTSGVAEVKIYLSLRYAIEAAIRRYYKGDIHAFARMDQSLRQNYTEMLNLYEQRLIDFDQEDPGGVDAISLPTGDTPLEVTHEPAAGALGGYPPAGPIVTGPHTPISSPSSPGLPVVSSKSGAIRLPQGGADLESLMRAQVPRPPTAPLQPLAGAQTRSYGSSELDSDSFVQTVGVLVSLIESGQGWRQGHSSEVGRLAGSLGERVGLDPDGMLALRLASYLHDLGKPADPHLTLLSLEALPEARALASKVFATPIKLLESARLPAEVERTITSVYERVDGHGVPGKRYGREIPLGARMIATIDAYLDLTCNPRTPGGRTEDPEAAVQRLREAAARKLFDPDVVNLLHQVVAESLRERMVGGRAHVLLIDSDLGSTTVLEQKLAYAGYDVRVVRTTAEAALVVLSEKVDLILSEVRLEPVDGFVFLERLRADPRTQTLPFLFVSERADAEDVNRGFELGAIDYIVKPFTPEVLVAKLKRVLEQRPR
jgi:response regulator RpfG family c-di-GMP phosphodiesterase